MNEKNETNNYEIFEELEIIMSLKNIIKLPKRGQILRNIDPKKVSQLAKIPIKELFGRESASMIQMLVMSKNPKRLVITEGNHRFASIDIRDLTEEENSTQIVCLATFISLQLFEDAWRSCYPLDTHPAYPKNRENIPTCIIEKCVKIIAHEEKRNKCSYSTSDTIAAYTLFFNNKVSDSEKKAIQMCDTKRKALYTKFVREGILPSGEQKTKDIFDIVFLPQRTSTEVNKLMLEGKSLLSGNHFISKFVKCAMINDEETAKLVNNFRIGSGKENSKRFRQKMIENITSSIKFGTPICKPFQVNSEGFVILENQIPDELYLYLETINVMILTPNQQAIKNLNNMKGGVGFGRVKRHTQEEASFIIGGPRVFTTDDTVNGKFYENPLLAVNRFSGKAGKRTTNLPLWRWTREIVTTANLVAPNAKVCQVTMSAASNPVLSNNETAVKSHGQAPINKDNVMSNKEKKKKGL